MGSSRSNCEKSHCDKLFSFHPRAGCGINTLGFTFALMGKSRQSVGSRCGAVVLAPAYFRFRVSPFCATISGREKVSGTHGTFVSPNLHGF